jgi:hypothetical protein
MRLVEELKNSVLLWLLRNKRPLYLKLKKLDTIDISQDSEFLDLHTELLQDKRGGQSLAERYNLYRLAKATANLQGAFAEVGVYRGGSAKLLCKVKQNSPIYLFDTYEGMPEVNKSTDGGFAQGDFADNSYEDVAAYLSSFQDVHLVKGLFPDSAIGKEPSRQKYRFVHLDLDIYESTLKALEFFYPRIVPGGILVSHDYRCLCAPGVRSAFEAFFKGKLEPILPLWDTQCAIVKMPSGGPSN